jgi:phosphoglycolate phosphatase
VEELILNLSGRYLLGIVTIRSRYHLEQFMARFPAIAGAFNATSGLQDTRRVKPHPEPVYAMSRRLGVSPEECLVVGDTPVDIRCGRRAGAYTAGVLCGFGRRDELQKAGADIILDTTADLLKYV